MLYSPTDMDTQLDTHSSRLRSRLSSYARDVLLRRCSELAPVLAAEPRGTRTRLRTLDRGSRHASPTNPLRAGFGSR